MNGALRGLVLAMTVLAAPLLSLAASAGDRTIGVNVLLNTAPSARVLADLAKHGRVRDVLVQIDAVSMQAKQSQLDTIRRLPFVISASPDARRDGAPVDTVDATAFANGIRSYDQDAINVINSGTARAVAYDGTGVYVAVLDSGLLDSWRQYFPQERIAEEYARAFGGGGGLAATVSSQPNKWQHDQSSHGTHVTSSILGYSLLGTPVNGAAPGATVIPVKVLNQNGSGWSSVITRGILYVADLKAGALAGSPVVINMSLGGAVLDAVEKAAIDYAIAKGVVIVASAGNEGAAGMGYPGGYAPVISSAASGWTGQWLPGADGNPNNWWTADDVAEPTAAGDFYIADFSSRELEGQDLDVVAPGSWIVGPYQAQSGQVSYFYVSGTSQASPHVAGIAALLLQKNPSLTAAQVESILESTAIPLPAGCRDVTEPGGVVVKTCWEANATGAGLTTADAALAATP